MQRRKKQTESDQSIDTSLLGASKHVGFLLIVIIFAIVSGTQRLFAANDEPESSGAVKVTITLAKDERPAWKESAKSVLSNIIIQCSASRRTESLGDGNENRFDLPMINLNGWTAAQLTLTGSQFGCKKDSKFVTVTALPKTSEGARFTPKTVSVAYNNSGTTDVDIEVSSYQFFVNLIDSKTGKPFLLKTNFFENRYSSEGHYIPPPYKSWDNPYNSAGASPIDQALFWQAQEWRNKNDNIAVDGSQSWNIRNLVPSNNPVHMKPPTSLWGFKNLTNGKHRLQVYYLGYEPVDQEVNLDLNDSKIQSLTITLKPLETPELVSDAQAKPSSVRSAESSDAKITTVSKATFSGFHSSHQAVLQSPFNTDPTAYCGKAVGCPPGSAAIYRTISVRPACGKGIVSYTSVEVYNPNYYGNGRPGWANVGRYRDTTTLELEQYEQRQFTNGRYKGAQFRFVKGAGGTEEGTICPPSTSAREIIQCVPWKEFTSKQLLDFKDPEVKAREQARVYMLNSSDRVDRSFSNAPQPYCVDNCGNAVVDKGEECDEGDNNGGKKCTKTCEFQPKTVLDIVPTNEVKNNSTIFVTALWVPTEEIIFDEEVCGGGYDKCIMVEDKENRSLPEEEQVHYLLYPHEIKRGNINVVQWMGFLDPAREEKAITRRFILLGAKTVDPKEPLAEKEVRYVGGGDTGKVVLPQSASVISAFSAQMKEFFKRIVTGLKGMFAGFTRNNVANVGDVVGGGFQEEGSPTTSSTCLWLGTPSSGTGALLNILVLGIETNPTEDTLNLAKLVSEYKPFSDTSGVAIRYMVSGDDGACSSAATAEKQRACAEYLVAENEISCGVANDLVVKLVPGTASWRSTMKHVLYLGIDLPIKERVAFLVNAIGSTLGLGDEFAYRTEDLRFELAYPNCNFKYDVSEFWKTSIDKGEGDFKINYLKGCGDLSSGGVKPTKDSLMNNPKNILDNVDGFGLVSEQYMVNLLRNENSK